MDLQEKTQICKIVALAILSDARITDDEYGFIQNLMDRWGLTEEQQRQALARNIGDDPGELLKSMKIDDQHAGEVLSELVQGVASDGKVTGSERELLEQVREVLGIEVQVLDQLLQAALGI